MGKQTVVAGLIGLVIVAAIVGGILFSTRHNRVELTAKFLQVRAHQIDDDNALVLVDIRVTNPSTQQFVVKEVSAQLEDAGGKTIEGEIASERDAQLVFQYYPVLGKKYNQNLMIRQKINPNETIDRMIVARFPGKETVITTRKNLKFVVTDADRATTTLSEH